MKIIALKVEGKGINVFLPLRDKYELSIDQFPVGLIAQLVRALHRYLRGHGSDSRSRLNLFSGFFFSTA